MPSEQRARLSECRIAIVGATGAVGRELLRILEDRDVPREHVVALSSPRSAGTTIAFGNGELTVEELSDDALQNLDIVFFTANGDVARAWAPRLAERGVLVVDNSSAFRLDPTVPLVVPEVNADAIRPEHRLIANPNCSTILLLVAIAPIHRLTPIRRAVVSTYQAVSGAGAAAIDELYRQTHAAVAGDSVRPAVFNEPCAFNVFSHDSPTDPQTGRNTEEDKLLNESVRILGEAIPMSVSCMRVPVIRAHTETVNLTLHDDVGEIQIYDALRNAPGLRLVDDRSSGAFPTPLKASGGDDVLIGRIRLDPSQLLPENPQRGLGVDLMLSGDQLRKGAALNAVQIAEAALKVTPAAPCA